MRVGADQAKRPISTLIGAVMPTPPFNPRMDNPIDYLIRHGPVSFVDDSSYKNLSLIKRIHTSEVDMSVTFDRVSNRNSIPLKDRIAFFVQAEAAFDRTLRFLDEVYRRQSAVITRLQDGPNPYTDLAMDQFGDGGRYAQNALESAIHRQRGYRQNTRTWIDTLNRLKGVSERLREGLEHRSPTYRRSLGKIFVY
jgi:hypothetical protein